MSTPRVAIAHDYLTQRGGAERVVLSLLEAFPDARLYTTLYDAEATYPEFRDVDIVTSPLNQVPLLRRHHHAALPLLASASERFQVDADVTIASSSGWAHGFDIRGRRIVYCHNPARWLYQSGDYLGQGPGPRARAGRSSMRTLGSSLRRWDRAAAAKADSYFANSRVVQHRIKRAYDIDAEVLPPPHGIDSDLIPAPVPELVDWAAHGFHLVVSRLLPYKNVDVMIEAFRDLPHRLVVVGRGPEEHRLRAALGPRMRLVSGLSDEQMHWVYAHAISLMAPSLEDFGLTPLEAAVFGKPTVALRAGGYLDTIVEGSTGVFFDTCEPAAIRAALLEVEYVNWSAQTLADHAQRFTRKPFAARLHAEVETLLSQPSLA